MDLAALIEAGDSLLQDALEALCRYHEARDSSTPEDEVERLRLEAESLMQALQQYQQRALGGPGSTLH